MINLEKHGVILSPTSNEFENQSTFNPGVLQEKNTIHIVYRALDQKYMSTFGYARLNGPLEVVERWDTPFMKSRFKYESKGIEDPHLVKIGKTIHMTFVAHDGKNALIALASGPDIFHLKHKGIISPMISYARAGRMFLQQKLKDDYLFFASYYENMCAKDVILWEKDGLLFPEKIKRKFALLHRVLPDIQLALADSLDDFKNRKYWTDQIQNLAKNVVLEGRQGFEARHIGGGAPPIKTRLGWLIIYHGVEPLNDGRTYYGGAALLDLKDPYKTIARLPYPLLTPIEPFEQKGHVHNVVFPSGTAIFKGRLYIYYGSADTYTAVASIELNELLRELMRYKVK
jgi:beta-1,2-mannobiose phosphorylase / 1,2-beta-oligomannan phosphorylase